MSAKLASRGLADANLPPSSLPARQLTSQVGKVYHPAIDSTSQAMAARARLGEVAAGGLATHKGSHAPRPQSPACQWRQQSWRRLTLISVTEPTKPCARQLRRHWPRGQAIRNPQRQSGSRTRWEPNSHGRGGHLGNDRLLLHVPARY